MHSEEMIKMLDTGSFKTAVIYVNDRIYAARIIAETLLPKQPPTNEEVMEIARTIGYELANIIEEQNKDQNEDQVGEWL